LSRHRVLKLPAEARVPANEGVFEAVVQPGIISHRARRDLVHRSRRELQHAGQILCLRVQIARAARQAARKQDVAVAGEGKRVAVEDVAVAHAETTLHTARHRQPAPLLLDLMRMFRPSSTGRRRPVPHS